MTDVTVIIPSKNRRAMLARTLHSVLSQRDVDLEVIVVDDGGADGTAAAVASLGDARVSVHRHDVSKGVSAARNAGIAMAESTWLAFVDDDDLWSPSKIRAQLDALAATPGARWSCAGAVHIDERCHIVGGDSPPVETDVADLVLASNRVPGGGSGTLVDRALAVSVGGFDEAMSNLADWDFYIRLALAAPCASVLGYHVGSSSTPRVWRMTSRGPPLSGTTSASSTDESVLGAASSWVIRTGCCICPGWPGAPETIVGRGL